MHGRTSYVHWFNHYKQVDPSWVVHNYSWVKCLFYHCSYIFHLKYHWFSNEQFVYDPIINQVPLEPMRGWGPIVQVPKSVIKTTTHLLFLYGKEWIHSWYYVPNFMFGQIPTIVGNLNRLKQLFSHPCKLKNKPSQAEVHNSLRIKIESHMIIMWNINLLN